MDAMIGDEVWLLELGTVVIEKIHQSGAAVVRDYDDRRWLVPADVFALSEVSLTFFGKDGD